MTVQVETEPHVGPLCLHLSHEGTSLGRGGFRREPRAHRAHHWVGGGCRITARSGKLVPEGALRSAEAQGGVIRRALSSCPLRESGPLTLPPSTISFCRLVDVVTKSRMACRDQNTCHSRGGLPRHAAHPGVAVSHSPSSGLCTN